MVLSKMSIASGTSDAPEIPANLGLPIEYKPRRCRWCRVWSYQLCQWDQRGTVLQSWHPLIPWHRGSKHKPSGEGCKVCAIVWDQCFAARFVCADRFAKAVEADPTIFHKFQDIAANLIKMKIANPGMKFRVEMNLGCLENIKTTQTNEQGLEANDIYFVELETYKKSHGEPDPRDVIWDTLPDGSRVQGVNVQKGDKGWWKRIDRRLNGVKREAQLTDENIDPTGEALDHIQNAAKRAVLTDIRPALFIDSQPASSSSSRDLFVAAKPTPSEAGSKCVDGDDKKESDDSGSDEAPAGGLMNLLKRFGGSGESSRAKAKPTPKSRAPKAASCAVRKVSCATEKAEKSKKQAKSAPAKTVVGNAGKRKAGDADLDNMFNDDDDNETGLSKSDNLILDAFWDKLKPLREVSAPIADKEFRAKLAEHNTNFTQFFAECRLKKKSLNRRVCGMEEQPQVVTELEKIEAEAKQVQWVIKCLLGQVSVENESTLLSTLDNAGLQLGMTFSGSVVRRALKTLVFEDVKVTDFTRMMSVTYKTIVSRFVVDEENKHETADQFFVITIGQILQKLVKSILAQKSKDTQPQITKLENFLDAIHISSVSSLADDAGVLLTLLRKETTSVPKLKASVEQLSTLAKQKGPVPGMQLCAVVMGTTFGARLIADAKAQIETRGVEDSLVEELQTSFAPLRELADKGVACDRSEKDIKQWCKCIAAAADAIQQVKASKQSSKILGKDAANEHKAILDKSVALLAWSCCNVEVCEWLKPAIESMQSQHCFKEPEIINEDWSSISKMEQLKPFQVLLQTAAELSKYTIGAKSGVSVACGERLHALLTAFANAILDFEESLAVIQPKVSKEEVKGFMTEVEALVKEIRSLRDNITEKEADSVKLDLISALDGLTKPFKDIVFSLEDVSQKTERLSLLAAALPPDGEKRALQLRVVKFLDLMFGLVHVLHGKADLSPEDFSSDLIKELRLKHEALEAFQLDDSCKEVVNALKTTDSQKEIPFTPDALAKSFFQFEQYAITVESSWAKKKAAELGETIDKIKALDIPDASTLGYSNDVKTCPKHDRDFPALVPFEDKMQQLSEIAAAFHDKMHEVKTAGMDKRVLKFDEAVAVQNNLMSIVSVLVIVKIMSTKRFLKAVESGSAIPTKFAKELSEALETCTEYTLMIPGGLQAQAAMYSTTSKTAEVEQST